MTLHDDATRARILARLETLTPDASRSWGRMQPDQMLWHINAGLSSAVGDLACQSIVTPVNRLVLRWVALYGPWPKEKVPTAKEYLAAGTYDFDVERSRVRQLILKLAAKPIQGRWPAHPAFGPLSGRQWSLLQYRHVDYHFRQFGV